MPVISRFHGMVVKMYFLASEHNPPHVHFELGEEFGVFDIKTLSLVEGHLPPNALKRARLWIRIHQTELLEMWATQNFHPLPALD